MESDASGPEAVPDDELDIDERSDDEDDRAAHELLHAAPSAMSIGSSPSPVVLPYNHQGFSVSPR